MWEWIKDHLFPFGSFGTANIGNSQKKTVDKIVNLIKKLFRK